MFPKRGSKGPQVKLLTIWFGANDACLEQSPQCVRIFILVPNYISSNEMQCALQVSVERFVQNMKTLISMVQSPESEWYSPSTKIVLITPPPISETARAADLASRDPPLACDRTAEHSKRYVDAVLALGEEFQLPTVNVYQPIWDLTENGNPAKLAIYLGDGLHLTAAGYTVSYSALFGTFTERNGQILFDELMRTIQTSYPELYPEAVPMQFPP